MTIVLTFSTQFPSYHPKKGTPTYFPEQIINSLKSQGISLPHKKFYPLQFLEEYNHEVTLIKNHTIRAGNRFKKGDYFSPRIWSGKPYRSNQIIISQDLQVANTWEFELRAYKNFISNDILLEWYIDGKKISSIGKAATLAVNDGLTIPDMVDWFAKPFKGQIICWNPAINY